jgi:hypothetical protein
LLTEGREKNPCSTMGHDPNYHLWGNQPKSKKEFQHNNMLITDCLKNSYSNGSINLIYSQWNLRVISTAKHFSWSLVKYAFTTRDVHRLFINWNYLATELKLQYFIFWLQLPPGLSCLHSMTTDVKIQRHPIPFIPVTISQGSPPFNFFFCSVWTLWLNIWTFKPVPLLS